MRCILALFGFIILFMGLFIMTTELNDPFGGNIIVGFLGLIICVLGINLLVTSCTDQSEYKGETGTITCGGKSYPHSTNISVGGGGNDDASSWIDQKGIQHESTERCHAELNK